MAGITRGVALSCIVVLAISACRPATESARTAESTGTPAVYERFTAALTATAAAGESDMAAGSSGSPNGAYPFEVVYRDFGSLPVGHDNTIEKLLALMPDTPETRAQVWVNDLHAFWGLWERVGVERPVDEDGADAYRERRDEMILRLRASGVSAGDLLTTDSPAWVAGLGDSGHFTSVDFFPYAGVDARDADSTIRTGGQGMSPGFVTVQDPLEIALGTYDAGAITDAIAHCGECARSRPGDRAGLAYMAWGDDFEAGSRGSRMKGPFFDYFGQGGRVAVFDGAIYRALSTEGIEQLIDARAGSVANLAQDANYRLAAAGLTALNAYSAIVSSTDFSFSGLRRNLRSICIARDTKGASGGPAVLEAAGSSPTTATSVCQASGHPGSEGLAVARTSPPMKPFEMAAFGKIWDPERTATDSAIVVIHRSDQEARENVELLLRRLAQTRVPDGVSIYADEIERVEIETIGPVLLARVVTDRLYGGMPISYLEPNLVVRIPPAIHE